MTDIFSALAPFLAPRPSPASTSSSAPVAAGPSDAAQKLIDRVFDSNSLTLAQKRQFIRRTAVGDALGGERGKAVFSTIARQLDAQSADSAKTPSLTPDFTKDGALKLYGAARSQVSGVATARSAPILQSLFPTPQKQNVLSAIFQPFAPSSDHSGISALLGGSPIGAASVGSNAVSRLLDVLA